MISYYHQEWILLGSNTEYDPFEKIDKNGFLWCLRWYYKDKEHILDFAQIVNVFYQNICSKMKSLPSKIKREKLALFFCWNIFKKDIDLEQLKW